MHSIRFIIMSFCLLMFHSATACTLRDESNVPSLLIPTRYKNENLSYAYTVQLAALAIEKTQQDFGPCAVIPLKNNHPINRTLLKIQNGKSFDVVDSTASKTRDETLLPINFPVYRGLMSYRVAAIREGEQYRFDKVRDIEDLKQFTIGAASHWKDNEIVAKAGFTTFPGDSLRSLYKMLPAGRFDILLRGAHEVIVDRMRIGNNIGATTIEKNLVLAFPLPVNFYVKKGNTALAKRLEVGLKRALEDGDADKLFYKSPLIKETLANLKLNKRRYFYICNHTLTRDIQLTDDRLWYVPWPKSIQACKSD